MRVRAPWTGVSPVPRCPVDANGLPLRVGVSAANTHDSQTLEPMLSHFHMGHETHATDSKPQRLPADKAYDVPHLRRRIGRSPLLLQTAPKTDHEDMV
ncbi:hypothetical protein GCM10010279_05480 [Streptomyces mutabilis]|nr:hypothetical protein GCM10010279_05480 [Streptomyces mutabilis]